METHKGDIVAWRNRPHEALIVASELYRVRGEDYITVTEPDIPHRTFLITVDELVKHVPYTEVLKND